MTVPISRPTSPSPTTKTQLLSTNSASQRSPPTSTRIPTPASNATSDVSSATTVRVKNAVSVLKNTTSVKITLVNLVPTAAYPVSAVLTAQPVTKAVTGPVHPRAPAFALEVTPKTTDNVLAAPHSCQGVRSATTVTPALTAKTSTTLKTLAA